jgi:hypothetical protein
MGTHGGKPFQIVKGSSIVPVLGPVHPLGFIGEAGHSLLGERCPDDVADDVFHGLFVAGLNPAAATDVESGMPP